MVSVCLCVCVCGVVLRMQQISSHICESNPDGMATLFCVTVGCCIIAEACLCYPLGRVGVLQQASLE